MFALNYLTQELHFYENSDARTDWTGLVELTGVSEGSVVRLPIHRQEPLRLELIAFAAAVAAGGPPSVPAAAALDSLRLARELVAAASGPPPAPR